MLVLVLTMALHLRSENQCGTSGDEPILISDSESDVSLEEDFQIEESDTKQ